MRRNFGNRMAKTLVLVLLALVGSLAQAQHVRWDNTATTTTGVGQMLPVLALPGASISFYTGCTALPCATPAATYQSASGASCPSNAQVVWQAAVGTGCHATADSEGNFGGWFAPGDYQYTITINSTTAGPYDFAVGSGGGTPVMNLQHNSSTTGINQTIYNLCDNGSCGPALDAGMQKVYAKTGAGDGSWVLETLAATGGIQPQYQVPTSGNYIIMLPSSCTASSASFGTSSCGAAPDYSMTNYIFGRAALEQVTTTDTGWSYNDVPGLPSFVSASNVTAIYGGVTALWNGLPNACGGAAFDGWLTNHGNFSLGLPSYYPYGQTTVLTQIDGGSPTTFNFATSGIEIGNQQSTICSGSSYRIAVPYIVVYYTGAAPPASNNLSVAAPLTLSNNVLGLQWPLNAAKDTGTSTAYVVQIPWLKTTVGGTTFNNISPGADLWINPANANTTTNPTLNLNSLGAVNILGIGSGAIAVGDIVAGQMAHLVYGADGNWHLQNPATASYAGPANSIAGWTGNGAALSPYYLATGLQQLSSPTAIDAKALPAVVGSGAPVAAPAISVMQTCFSDAATCAMGSNVTSGDLLLVPVAYTAPAPTDTLATPFTLIASDASNGISVYGGIAASSGADTITVASAPATAVMEVSGVSKSVDITVSSTVSGQPGSFSIAASPVYQSDFVFLAARAPGNFATGGSYSYPLSNAHNDYFNLYYFSSKAAGSYALSSSNISCGIFSCTTDPLLLIAFKTSTTTPVNGRNYYNAAASYACYVADGTNWNACGAAGGGAVSSVFGRTGAVTAQSGDYSVSQVTGAAPLASPTFTGTVNLPSTTIIGGAPTNGQYWGYNGTSQGWYTPSGGGGMVYPGAGVANSTGTAWGTSYAVGTAANNLVQLNGTAQLPAVSGALLTNLPVMSLTTTGTSGPATLSGGVLNIPQYAGGIADTTVTVASATQGANSCSSTTNVTMTGLTTSMVIETGYSTNPTTLTGWGSSGGMIFQIWPSAANTATWQVCNQTAASITFSAITFNVGAK